MLVADETNVYWLDWSPCTSRVMQAPRAGGAAVTLASRALVGQSIAVDGAHVLDRRGVADGGPVERHAHDDDYRELPRRSGTP